MKKYSRKFWIGFWLLAVMFLTGWFMFWEYKNQGIGTAVTDVISFLPIDENQKAEYKTLGKIADYFLKNDGKERTLLVLFQNNMEIRPGGGFIGAFGIVKIKDGSVISIETHDLSNFDGRIPDTVEPPYPMKETLGIKSWKLRDSNYSPDFTVNAEKAIEFYRMGNGQEELDGVIGITANTLTSMLKVTGPIEIEGYPGTYDSENAIISLEYQVEKAFEQQGIDRGERKSIMNDLAKEIQKRVWNLSAMEKIELAKILIADLEQKDIQLYFKDEQLQQTAMDSNWAGVIDASWNNDYVMPIDANLGAFKSDYYVKRSVDYTIDLTKENPAATLKITYQHTAKEKDWMTKDYLTYLRVYVPDGAWLVSAENFTMGRYGNELGKKYFASIVRVPLNSTKTVTLEYTLPKDIAKNYELKIQKQAGLIDVPMNVHIIDANGSQRDYATVLHSDMTLSEINGIQY